MSFFANCFIDNSSFEGNEVKYLSTILGSQVESYFGFDGRSFEMPLKKRKILGSVAISGPTNKEIADL